MSGRAFSNRRGHSSAAHGTGALAMVRDLVDKLPDEPEVEAVGVTTRVHLRNVHWMLVDMAHNQTTVLGKVRGIADHIQMTAQEKVPLLQYNVLDTDSAMALATQSSDPDTDLAKVLYCSVGAIAGTLNHRDRSKAKESVNAEALETPLAALAEVKLLGGGLVMAHGTLAEVKLLDTLAAAKVLRNVLGARAKHMYFSFQIEGTVVQVLAWEKRSVFLRRADWQSGSFSSHVLSAQAQAVYASDLPPPSQGSYLLDS